MRLLPTIFAPEIIVEFHIDRGMNSGTPAIEQTPFYVGIAVDGLPGAHYYGAALMGDYPAYHKYFYQP